jgi:hypothetical protein
LKYHLLTKPVTCVPSTTLQCSDLPYYIHIRGKVYMIYTLVNWLSYNIEAYYIVPIGKWFSKFSNWNLVIFTAILCSGWPFPRNVNVEIVLECTTLGTAIYILINRISGVMISVIPSSAINRGFEPRSSQTKDYTISILLTTCYLLNFYSKTSKSYKILILNLPFSTTSDNFSRQIINS